VFETSAIIAGKYRIIKEIGRGCFGIIYLSEEVDTGRLRAVKILLPAAAKDESLRHRLRREAKLASRLQNPHAVKIFDSGETDEGNVFVAMEYLQGEELSKLLRRYKRLTVERATNIAHQILDSLEEAHSHGVIHRDLKPNNIFICDVPSQADYVKVIDFGIAKVIGGGDLVETTRLTFTGEVLGSPVYMSPEQCRSAELTAASDLYSLGVVLYEMVSGDVPFDDENPVRVLLMHDSQPVPALPRDVARTELGRAIMLALAKDLEDRPVSVGEFREALEGRIPKRLKATGRGML